ncbi:RNA polymerase sigma-70 factor, ECF subfamily [Desulfotomaculum arcticum]|uniref:RNA polymerase sigma-70 factor, ECF subfamily n=1 Tax=Desulfotruncus arcticus DSM 17038 TaxID=1121424 RepID=A0A1I2UMU0_9FIRM|nr:sigma-70 family RNA polymerase sigma factor [Desulfotruncus arcticus]SFG76166.1 RNA polymerase sigma-70 factor, ECF subfamily [Desulfotomaculum arcticum] [Desulfotruncus arcticus DSM 17038]
MIADEILVKKAQGGDTAAFGELVRRYQNKVYGFTLKMFAAPEDARDAAQEIFIRVFRALPGFNLRSSFATWLYRIATNLCLDLLQRRARDIKRQVPLEDHWQDGSPGPEADLLEKERAGAVKEAVNELPDGYRVVLVLHHYQGLSYKQVSAVMELSEKTVATRIHRAKKMLREKLVGGEDGALPESKGKTRPVPGRGMSVL